jgi:Protein of unknown function (DUF2007).
MAAADSPASGELARAGPKSNRIAFTRNARPANVTPMIELLRTNDAVVISFVESLLRDAGINFLVADQNMSIMEGSLGVLPRRVLVTEEQAEAARKLLKDAGVAGDQLR